MVGEETVAGTVLCKYFGCALSFFISPVSHNVFSASTLLAVEVVDSFVT